MIKNLSVVVLVAFFGLLLASLIIILTGCSKNRTQHVKPRFSGDHTTTEIRGMWYICYQTRQVAFPLILPPINTAHCDCLVDKSRENYSASDYNKVDQNILSKFFKSSSIECDTKIVVPVEPIKLPLKQL